MIAALILHIRILWLFNDFYNIGIVVRFIHNPYLNINIYRGIVFIKLINNHWFIDTQNWNHLPESWHFYLDLDFEREYLYSYVWASFKFELLYEFELFVFSALLDLKCFYGVFY
jgi:hypothetical protein